MVGQRRCLDSPVLTEPAPGPCVCPFPENLVGTLKAHYSLRTSFVSPSSTVRLGGGGYMAQLLGTSENQDNSLGEGFRAMDGL